MQVTNLNDLINYLKFGYEGETIDLIYLGLFLYVIFKLTVWLMKKIKRKGDFSL